MSQNFNKFSSYKEFANEGKNLERNTVLLRVGILLLYLIMLRFELFLIKRVN